MVSVEPTFRTSPSAAIENEVRRDGRLGRADVAIVDADHGADPFARRFYPAELVGLFVECEKPVQKAEPAGSPQFDRHLRLRRRVHRCRDQRRRQFAPSMSGAGRSTSLRLSTGDRCWTSGTSP
jgi:hypothetical protein